MSKYSRLMMQPLYSDINFTINKLNEFLFHPININLKNNNTVPVALISSNLDRVYSDNEINGSIKKLLTKLTKLKPAIENIIKIQELDSNLEKLKLQKYNVDGTINVNVANKINILENEIYLLERKIDISLNDSRW